jgi:hypothetical protein
MAWGNLNNTVDLDAPNRMTEKNDVLGADTTTLGGKTRRSIRSLKRIWSLSYEYMTASKYAELYGLYSAGNSVDFTIEDATYISVSGVSVFLDLDARDFIPGSSVYLSNVNLTLHESE